MNPPLLEVRNLSKFYGEIPANKNISLNMTAGSIHALIGENGAGKSTLMKMLFGLEQPTSGTIIWKNRERSFNSAQEAKRAGIGMVHQHFMQAENLTALDHLALEMSARVGFWKRLRPVPWNRLRKEARELATRFQMNIPWDKQVADLSVIEQQRLEILNLLSEDAELLILDEPTAVLSPLEIQPFLDRLVDLKKSGKSIVLISHKLKEVTAIADTVSVLRRGELVWSGSIKDKSENDLANLMISGQFAQSETDFVKPEPATARKILNVDLRKIYRHGPASAKTTHPLFEDLKIEMHAGEIVGFAGVEGNGQTDITELILFPQRFSGDVLSKIEFTGLRQQKVNILGRSSLDIRRRGIGWIPPDRHQQAVVLSMTASENLAIAHQHDGRYRVGSVMRWGRLRKDLKSIVQQFDVRPAKGNLRLSAYSGGNQQKIVVGREFEASPQLLIAEHPTRGVDLAAAGKIHDAFRTLKREHSSVILISADLDELTKVCDRILVFYRHRIQAEFGAAEFDVARIGQAMAGLT